MTDFKGIWETLSAIDVNEHTEKKGKFTYLSWTWGWATLMEHYPQANYAFREPVSFPDGSLEVWCEVSIDEHTRSMWLPVMDHKNNAKLNPNARDISDTRMRCLVKCLAMFGLGHYIYAGESMPDTGPDLPSDEEKATFLMYKENQDAIRFFLFARHLGDEKYTNLYNSAPKDKMKFKKACDELEKQGAKDSTEVVDTVKGLLDNNDPAWKEELEGLEPCEKQVLWKLFDEKTQKLMQNFKG